MRKTKDLQLRQRKLRKDLQHNLAETYSTAKERLTTQLSKDLQLNLAKTYSTIQQRPTTQFSKDLQYNLVKTYSTIQQRLTAQFSKDLQHTLAKTQSTIQQRFRTQVIKDLKHNLAKTYNNLAKTYSTIQQRPTAQLSKNLQHNLAKTHNTIRITQQRHAKTPITITATEEISTQIFLASQPLKHVTHFKYQYSTASLSGETDAETEGTCNKVNQAIGHITHLLKNKYISTETRRALYNPNLSFILFFSSVFMNPLIFTR